MNGESARQILRITIARHRTQWKRLFVLSPPNSQFLFSRESAEESGLIESLAIPQSQSNLPLRALCCFAMLFHTSPNAIPSVCFVQNFLQCLQQFLFQLENRCQIIGAEWENWVRRANDILTTGKCPDTTGILLLQVLMDVAFFLNSVCITPVNHRGHGPILNQ
jgi:hypothetical protein